MLEKNYFIEADKDVKYIQNYKKSIKATSIYEETKHGIHNLKLIVGVKPSLKLIRGYHFVSKFRCACEGFSTRLHEFHIHILIAYT